MTTKIHAVVDANGNPVAIKLTAGQAHDGRSAEGLLNTIDEGQILLADRGYNSDALRAAVANRGAWANIKPMPNRVNVPAFSPWLYRYRNLVERFFSKLKHFETMRRSGELTLRQRLARDRSPSETRDTSCETSLPTSHQERRHARRGMAAPSTCSSASAASSTCAGQ